MAILETPFVARRGVALTGMLLLWLTASPANAQQYYQGVTQQWCLSSGGRFTATSSLGRVPAVGECFIPARGGGGGGYGGGGGGGGNVGALMQGLGGMIQMFAAQEEQRQQEDYQRQQNAINYNHGQGTQANEEGRRQLAANNCAGARDWFQRALTFFQANGDQANSNVASGNTQLAINCLERGQQQAAAQLQQQEDAAARQKAVADEQAARRASAQRMHSLNEQGIAAYNARRYDNAIKAFQDAANIAKSIREAEDGKKYEENLAKSRQAKAAQDGQLSDENIYEMCGGNSTCALALQAKQVDARMLRQVENDPRYRQACGSVASEQARVYCALGFQQALSFQPGKCIGNCGPSSGLPIKPGKGPAQASTGDSAKPGFFFGSYVDFRKYFVDSAMARYASMLAAHEPITPQNCQKRAECKDIWQYDGTSEGICFPIDHVDRPPLSVNDSCGPFSSPVAAAPSRQEANAQTRTPIPPPILISEREVLEMRLLMEEMYATQRSGSAGSNPFKSAPASLPSNENPFAPVSATTAKGQEDAESNPFLPVADRNPFINGSSAGTSPASSPNPGDNPFLTEKKP